MGDMTFWLLYVFMLPAVTVFAIACTISWKWQSKMARLQEKMDRNRPVDLLRKMSAGCDGWPYPRSNGNRAFDEYRAETLPAAWCAVEQSSQSPRRSSFASAERRPRGSRNPP